MSRWEFEVWGTPVPQGSKRAFVVNGRAVIADVRGKELKEWRSRIAMAARAIAPEVPLDEAVTVRVVFGIEKPASVKREEPSVAPDLDKLLRALLDGLTDSGLIRDDSRVTSLAAEKVYASRPGARVVVAVRGRKEQS